jgi:hypothetical protein
VIVSQKGFHRELIGKYKKQIKGMRSYKTLCDAKITQDLPGHRTFQQRSVRGSTNAPYVAIEINRCDIAFTVNVEDVADLPQDGVGNMY